jgi:exodeoxyribonuclease VII small subunit
MSDDGDSKTYRENYRVLKETADWLAKPGETDIDQLVPKVEAAMKAYQFCKDRIETVKSKLNVYFAEAAGQSSEGEGAADADEDTPF